MSFSTIVDDVDTLPPITLDEVLDMLDCGCDNYSVCDDCRDYKWREGLCYGCLDECNPASQTCGRCARGGW